MRADGFPVFPKSFVFGAAAAAYQIEGSPDADGKGPSIWDVFTHTRGKVKTGETGDTACDHYRRYAEDVELMGAMGLSAYRGSISWPRIYPSGRGPVNRNGLDFYERLTDALLARGIDPYYTLFHWDLPDALQREYRGFRRREVSGYFADYVETVVRALGDRVGHWITLNEPFVYASLGSLLGTNAPGEKSMKGFMATLHHQLLGHGLALERIRAVSPGAEVGITLSLSPVYPATARRRDAGAAVLGDQIRNHLTLMPVMEGRYPPEVMRRLRLFATEIRPGDMEVISAKTDFIGINNYTRTFAERAYSVPFLGIRLDGADVIEGESDRDGVRRTAMGWEVYPESLYECISLLKERYGNPPMYVTENGAAFADVPRDGRIRDPKRIDFLRDYLERVSRAIGEGADVRGYFVWTFMDNFEWAEGFSKRFGIVHVDFETGERTIKDSGFWYRDLIRETRR